MHLILCHRWLLVLNQTDVCHIFFLQYMQFVGCRSILRCMFRKLILMKKCIMKKLTAAQFQTAKTLQFDLLLYLYLSYFSKENCTRIASFLLCIQLASTAITHSSYRWVHSHNSNTASKPLPRERAVKTQVSTEQCKGLKHFI